jgi:hypothetical protein
VARASKGLIEALAVTVGWIAVFFSVALFLLGWIQLASPKQDSGDHGDRDRPG